MVILDAVDDLGGPQGSYPESFSLLALHFCEVINNFGVNGQLLRGTREERQETRDEREESEVNSDLAP